MWINKLLIGMKCSLYDWTVSRFVTKFIRKKTVEWFTLFFGEPFKLIFTCFALMFLSRRVHLFGTYDDNNTKMCPEFELNLLFWLRLFFFLSSACFSIYEWQNPFVNEKESTNEMKGKKNYSAQHKFSCVVASFAWECANSTFIIRIIGFQYLFVYDFFVRVHSFFWFYSNSHRQHGWDSCDWLSSNTEKRTYFMFYLIRDTFRFDERTNETKKKTKPERYDSLWVTLCIRIHLLHSICKRFFTCMRFQNDHRITSCTSFVQLAYAIFFLCMR